MLAAAAQRLEDANKPSWRPVGKPRSNSYEDITSKHFSCPYCTYTTILKGNYIIHMRTHSGEKPYQCHFCDYKSTQKVNLKRHLITHRNLDTPTTHDNQFSLSWIICMRYFAESICKKKKTSSFVYTQNTYVNFLDWILSNLEYKFLCKFVKLVSLGHCESSTREQYLWGKIHWKVFSLYICVVDIKTLIFLH